VLLAALPGGFQTLVLYLTEHLEFAARAMTALGNQGTEIRLTCLDEAIGPLAEQVHAGLAGAPGVNVLDDPERTTGRGHYTGLCYKINAIIAGQRLEIGDGGFVDWTQQLIGNRKERLLISGFGVDKLAPTHQARRKFRVGGFADCPVPCVKGGAHLCRFVRDSAPRSRSAATLR
jgi:hypothetical protein